MSDIVLVYPRTGFDAKDMAVTLPLSVLAAATSAAREFKVRVIDQRIQDDWEEKLRQELRERPLCVGLSAMTGTQIHYALQVSRVAKEAAPEVPVVWGGMHATLLPEQTLRHPDVDLVVRGAGETALLELARALASRGPLDPIRGLAWKAPDGSIRLNPETDPLDLNALPSVPYELVDVEDYVSPSQYLYPGVTRLLPFQGSRGCPFKCTFCSEPVLTRAYGFRLMKPELFVARTMEMVERHRLDHVLFYDEEFFVNTKWAAEVAERIGGRYTWWAQTRANDLLKVDLKHMEACGLKIVAPGLESGSKRLLEWMRKEETVEEYLETNRRLSETGIIPQYNLMIGFPGESPEELNETVDLALALMRGNPRAVINQFSPLTPLPGTEMLRVVVEKFGFQPPETLEGWSGVARRRLPTPWLQRNKAVYLNLMYSSAFLHTAKRSAKAYWWVPGLPFDLYGSLVRRRWRRHRYENTWDTRLIRLAHRFYSPADFVKVPDGSKAPAHPLRPGAAPGALIPAQPKEPQPL